MSKNWDRFLNFKFHEAAGFYPVNGNAVIQSWQIEAVKLPTYPDQMYTCFLNHLIDIGARLKYYDHNEKPSKGGGLKSHELTKDVIARGLPSNISIQGYSEHRGSGEALPAGKYFELAINYKTKTLDGVAIWRLNNSTSRGANTFYALPDAIRRWDCWPQPAPQHQLV